MKRGMIIVEVFSIMFLAILSVVFLILIYMTLADDDTLIKESVADLQDHRAHIVLHNLLQMPVENTPMELRGAVQELTLYDLLALFEYDSNDPQSEKFQELFEQEFMRFAERSDTSTHALLFLLRMEEDAFFSRERKPGNLVVINTWNSKCKTKEELENLGRAFIVDGSYFPIHKTSMMVAGRNGPQALEFEYCWVER